MKVALCGYPPFALQLQEGLKNSDIEPKFFIRDFISVRGGGGNFTTNLPPINFFDFRRLVDAGELDGVIVAEDGNSIFTKNVVQACKFYEIPNVGIIFYTANPGHPIYFLETEKAYLAQLEANIIDGCNLNCKGCTHFAGLFRRDETYPLEVFKHDIRQVSRSCDVLTFYLLGGEPFLLKNLDEYMKISHRYLPKSSLRIVTNGVLIPSVSQKILDSIKANDFLVSISNYSPTAKMLDKIKAVLESNKIAYEVRSSVAVKNFNVFLSSHSGNAPAKSRAVCGNDVCRFLRDGKIYKCPIDALSYRFVEKFGVKNYPRATGVDIYAQNFSSAIQMLDGNVEMCYWCSEHCRQIPWTPTNNPQLEDWLADPDELKNFQ